MATDLVSILNQISSFAANIGEQRDQAQQRVDQNEQLRNQSIDALKQVGDLSQQVEAADTQQALEFEKRKKATAEAFGVDILDPQNRIAYLANEQAAAVDEALARSKEASSLIDMNLFDNPLSYMVQRPFAFRHEEAAKAANARAKIAGDAITKLNNQAQETVQTQKAINTELTVDEAAMRAQLSKLKAEEVIRVAQINSNNSYLNDIKELRGLDKTQLDAYVQAFSLKRHDEEFAARMEEMRANRELRAKQKRSEQEDLEYQMQRYNLGADTAGKPKAVSTADFKAMAKLNPVQTRKIIDLASGVWIDPREPDKVVKVQQIAQTPGQSIVELKSVEGKLPDSAQRVSAMINQEMANARDILSKNKTGKITMEDLANTLDKNITGWVDIDGKNRREVSGRISQMLSNVEAPTGMYDNIYRAPDTKVMAQVVPALTEMSGWNDIVIPATAASGPSPTVDSMLKQASIKIKEGKMSVEDASKFISSYYTMAMDVNKRNEQYSLIGLPTYAEDGKGTPKYNAPVTAASLLGSTKKIINAASKEEIERSLLREVVDLKKLQQVWGGR